MNDPAHGFPAWIRITHWVNVLLIGFVIRAGIQILAAYPRLYWNAHCIPGTEWIKFTRKVIHPERPWIAREQEEDWSPWVAQPGGNNLGLGHHWHFAAVGFWVLNGLIYVVLLFASGGWTRLIPTAWAVFPAAWNDFVSYLTLHTPPPAAFNPFDALQQLTYGAVVFLLAPFLYLPDWLTRIRSNAIIPHASGACHNYRGSSSCGVCPLVRSWPGCCLHAASEGGL